MGHPREYRKLKCVARATRHVFERRFGIHAQNSVLATKSGHLPNEIVCILPATLGRKTTGDEAAGEFVLTLRTLGTGPAPSARGGCNEVAR